MIFDRMTPPHGLDNDHIRSAIFDRVAPLIAASRSNKKPREGGAVMSSRKRPMRTP
jgi:hypothetical protein